MCEISVKDEFAKYTKLQRILNKKREELKAEGSLSYFFKPYLPVFSIVFKFIMYLMKLIKPIFLETVLAFKKYQLKIKLGIQYVTQAILASFYFKSIFQYSGERKEVK